MRTQSSGIPCNLRTWGAKSGGASVQGQPRLHSEVICHTHTCTHMWVRTRAHTWTRTFTHTFLFEFWDHKFLLLLLTLYSSVVVLVGFLYLSQRLSTSHPSLRLLHKVNGWTHSRSTCHVCEVGAQTHSPQRSIKAPAMLS